MPDQRTGDHIARHTVTLHLRHRQQQGASAKDDTYTERDWTITVEVNMSRIARAIAYRATTQARQTARRMGGAIVVKAR